METERIHLVASLARSAGGPAPALGSVGAVSILSQAAASYGARPSEDATVPTGFDPLASALFEAIVEGAYLVGNADGVFDEGERSTFERVVSAACGTDVAPQQIAALIADLRDQLRVDGLDRRIRSLGRAVLRVEHAREVLRIAALLAQATDDVSAVEREVLVKIARECRLGAGEVDAVLTATGHALGRGA
jgi:tellurite resistance protein